MKFSQLRNLTAVVEAGSVRQAALRLNISQPAVSKSIKNLEETIGARLLVRGPHGVAPTPSGEALIRRARVISAEIERAQNEVDFLEGASGGAISIGVTQTVTTNILPQAVIAFLHRHPLVRIYIEEENVSEVLDAVRDGSFDFAVCFLPGPVGQEDLHIETLMDESFIPAVRLEHPLSRKKSNNLEDLVEEDWVIFGRGEGRRLVFEDTFAAAGLQPPESAIESNSIGCTVSIIEASDRIALLPSQILTTNRMTQTVVPLQMASPVPTWTIALVSRQGAILPPVSRELIGQLRDVIGKANQHRSKRGG